MPAATAAAALVPIVLTESTVLLVKTILLTKHTKCCPTCKHHTLEQTLLEALAQGTTDKLKEGAAALNPSIARLLQAQQEPTFPKCSHPDCKPSWWQQYKAKRERQALLKELDRAIKEQDRLKKESEKQKAKEQQQQRAKLQQAKSNSSLLSSQKSNSSRLLSSLFRKEPPKPESSLLEASRRRINEAIADYGRAQRAKTAPKKKTSLLSKIWMKKKRPPALGWWC